MRSNAKAIGLGVLTSVAASLCCITPVLALLAGTSGMASTFSWIEPARPYLISFTILTLGFAWYQKLRSTKEADCCEPKKRTNFMQSKLFLGIITIFAAIMLSFPYYSHIFYDSASATAVIVEKNKEEVVFMIEGMTCESCEEHVNHEILKLTGIGNTEVSYPDGRATVTYDRTLVDIHEIKSAINSTGYTVTKIKKL